MAIKNKTGQEKIYFSTSYVDERFDLEGIYDGHYGKLMFGSNVNHIWDDRKPYYFVAFGSYHEWYRGYLNPTYCSKGEIYWYKTVSKRELQQIYINAKRLPARKNKKNRSYRFFNELLK